MHIGHILVPTDYSEASRSAARLGVAMAGTNGFKVVLLHVDELPEYGVRMEQKVGANIWGAYLEERNSWLHRQLRDFARPLKAPEGLLHYQVGRGDPAATILEYCERQRPSLLLLTPSGAGVGTDFGIGSVTIRVASGTDRSVLVFQHRHGEGPPARDGRYTHPLLVCAETSSVERAVDLLAGLTAPGSAVDLLFALPPEPPDHPSPPASYRKYLDERRRSAREALRNVNQSLQQRGFATTAKTADGDLASTTLTEVESHANDLIVFARSSRTKESIIPFSTIERVIRRAPVSVALSTFDPGA